MQQVNVNGEPVEEFQLFGTGGWARHISEYERDSAITLILGHLGMEVVRTNATSHGQTEIVLRKVEE